MSSLNAPSTWPAEIAGHCQCPCNKPYPIGATIRRDPRLHTTVINGHQTTTHENTDDDETPDRK